ncbi:phosphate-starvation-inducible PsiE family protein [Streptomyces xanthophaeus]|uniref:phosphate-starvation-inducible PsiE family protein n=1 Tax=Streptomyces xanthophaeus TaxID=67385 RepID=UPI00398F9A1E
MSAPTEKVIRQRAQHVLEWAEDCIHLVVAALLVLLAVLLTIGVIGDIVAAIRGPYNEQAIALSALDNSLVLFIVAELLHTVRLTIRTQVLDAEPFLVVGMIAGVRKLLIITAESEKTFQWRVQGVELVILTGLIITMAAAVYVWRRRSPVTDSGPQLEVPHT